MKPPLTGIITVTVTAFALLAGPAAADPALPQGPPVTSGGDGTLVLHCNAIGLPGFVGAIVINRNGEFGRCHFVP
jgi:hypothetical protein